MADFKGKSRLRAGLAALLWAALMLPLAGLSGAAETTLIAGLSLPRNLAGAEAVNGMYEAFAREVEAGTAGAVRVQIAYGGVLGRQEDRMSQMRRGIIHLNDAGAGVYGTIFPDIQIFSMPYLFPDEQTAWRVFDGPLGRRVAEDIRRKTGIRVLGWYSFGGFRHFSANRPITRVEDMAGLKFRVIGPVYALPIRALGASAVPIAFGELYTALKTGVVDGQENPEWVFSVAKLYQVQSHLTLDGHIFAFGPFGINDAAFGALEPAHQRILEDAAAGATAFNRRTVAETRASALAAVRAQGTIVIELPAAEKARFAAITQPYAIEWLRRNVDTPALIDEVLALVRELSGKPGRADGNSEG